MDTMANSASVSMRLHGETLQRIEDLGIALDVSNHATAVGFAVELSHPIVKAMKKGSPRFVRITSKVDGAGISGVAFVLPSFKMIWRRIRRFLTHRSD